MFRRVIIYTLLLVLVSLRPVFAENPDNLTPSNYVNDFANLLTPQFISITNQNLANFTKTTGKEISIVTINSLEKYSIEEYAAKLFKNWGIGKKNEDNGLLILISKNDRNVRIEVGYGLEGQIPDGLAGSIIRSYLLPNFRQNNYDAGLQQALSQIYPQLGYTANTSTTTSQTQANRHALVDDIFRLIKLSIIVLFLFSTPIIYFFSYLGRTKSWYLGGIIGFCLGLVIFIFLHWLVVPLILGLIGALLDFVLSRNYQKWSSLNIKTNWWNTRGGFWHSGGGGSSGGFGGFGGGSSGGGGASGRW